MERARAQWRSAALAPAARPQPTASRSRPSAPTLAGALCFRAKNNERGKQIICYCVLASSVGGVSAHAGRYSARDSVQAGSQRQTCMGRFLAAQRTVRAARQLVVKI